MWNVLPYRCPVCGTNVYGWSDRSEGTTLESEEECRQCGQFHFQFGYGFSEERVLFVFWGWSYTEDPPDRDPARVEARCAWRHDEFRSMVDPANPNPPPKDALVDWLLEHNCPLQAEALRSSTWVAGKYL